MQTNEPKRFAHEEVRVPPHDPMPGIDEQPIDVGATEDAQLPKETHPGRVRPLKREEVAKHRVGF